MRVFFRRDIDAQHQVSSVLQHLLDLACMGHKGATIEIWIARQVGERDEPCLPLDLSDGHFFWHRHGGCGHAWHGRKRKGAHPYEEESGPSCYEFVDCHCSSFSV